MAQTQRLPINKYIKTITYYRNPTEGEIKFGYGSIHYLDFDIGECLKTDGTLKKTIKSKFDGLVYRRSLH